MRAIVSVGGTCALLACTVLLSPLQPVPARQAKPKAEGPAVTEPPESFLAKVADKDRDVARRFYKKYLDVKGVPVVAAAAVADEALRRTHHLVTHLLAGRPDVLEAMAKHGTRLVIIGKDQVYTDMPEYRDSPNAAYLNERVRGTGGLGVTSFGEENLLNLPLDRYDDEFGRASALRGPLRPRRLQYVLDVPCNTLVRDPSERRPSSREGGTPRVAPFERVDRWVARQASGRWRTVKVRDGAKEPVSVKALLATVQTRDEDGRVGARERLVVLKSGEVTPRT